MKKIMLFLLTVVLMFSCFSCNKTIAEDEPALPDDFVEKKDGYAYNPGEFMGLAFEMTEQGKVVRYDLQDVSHWEQVDYYADADKLDVGDYTFQSVINRIEKEEGIIVSGAVCGERIGVDPRAVKPVKQGNNTAYTLTEFKIEKVFHGNPKDEMIVVREGYCPVVTNKDYYIEYTNEYTRLKDNQTVLLFLIPDDDGNYRSIYYQFPLQDDYADYSDAYLTEMLDYYRGVDSVYKYGSKPTYGGHVESENGETAILATGFSTRWPKLELTNEEMLEEFSDNILIQVAARYKIKLWPTGHVKYVDMDPPGRTFEGYQYWCSPRNFKK